MTRLLRILAWLAVAMLPAAGVAADDDWESGFRNPPESTKPWCYWYWISDNISRDGITRDLEAMARVGIGEAFIGNVDVNEQARGRVKVLSDEWWALVEHAIREGGRLGVKIGMFNCPGWSQSGGPWVTSRQAMRALAASETRLRGPGEIETVLPVPQEPFQDVAVIAFPAPPHDLDTAASRAAQVRCTPETPEAAKLADGKTETVCDFPPGAAGQAPFVIDLELTEPFTARSQLLHPARKALSVKCELSACDEAGQFQPVRSFTLDRHNTNVHVGFVPFAPVAVAFPAVTSRQFRLVLTGAQGAGGLAEIELAAAARLERFPEKQLAKMFQDPLPMWDQYLWPPQADSTARDLAVPADRVLDLRERMTADGKLRWSVPDGEWIVLRCGMSPTGTKNSPASPEGTGLEIDKMNREAVATHFDAFIGRLLTRMPAGDRTAFRDVVADSYEMGSQNWTDGLGERFQQTFGYDPRPWLPVLTGRLVGSADQSDRFLWDLRRLVADRVAYDYVGGLRELCEQHGLRLWLENYGHWGFPAEFLQYGGQSHQIGGEFWATGDLGSIELRAAASAAHIYGKPIVSAEAFTGGPPFAGTPWSLKRRGDWAATEGINHFVLHVYIHQPEERQPGVNAWFGTEFNRHNTWFDAGRDWIDYIRRCHFLLQQGRHAADVAYFIGEDTPKMTGVCRPELPTGYDFDYINAEAIVQRLTVRDGRLVPPDGTAYRLLVLPELETMRPAVLQKISELVAAGGAVYGSPPSRSPSNQDYPACDTEVQRLAAALWAGCDGQSVQRARFGEGHVFRGLDLATALAALDTPPAVQGLNSRQVVWTQRTTDEAEIFFLANQRDQPVHVVPTFRAIGKSPELWHPDTGGWERTAVFERGDGGVRVPITLEPRGSVFVVFRAADGPVPSVVEVTRNGEVLLTTTAPKTADLEPDADVGVTGSFTLAGWVKPAGDIGLPQEADTGVFLSVPRNDVVFPAHGNSLASEPGHAGAGIAAGRNGVAVYEHGASYFAPLLTHAAALSDWTHVAVVYRAGRPTLYLNGQPARQGLQSRQVVHPSPPSSSGPSGPFRGEAGEILQFGRALSDAEVVSLARSHPPAAGSSLPVITVTRDAAGAFQADVANSGDFAVRLSNGEFRSVKTGEMPAPLAIRGPWQVRFPPGRDVPAEMTWEALVSWPDHADVAIQHFSGTATYTRDFDLGSQPTTETRFFLDLGQVESLAEVSVNGHDVGVLWKAPFLADVTSAIRPGTNTLEIRVTNTWRNRLVGDKKFPQGFPGGTGPQFRPSLAVDIGLRADTPLLPAGLLGPVFLRQVRRIGLP